VEILINLSYELQLCHIKIVTCYITLNIIVELSEANVHAMELLLRTVTVPRSFPSKGDPANELYSSPFHSDVQYLFQSSFSDYFMF